MDFSLKFLKTVATLNILLTIPIGKKCVLLNSVQELTEIEALLLLTFFICLHNHLSSKHCHVLKSTDV